MYIASPWKSLVCRLALTAELMMAFTVPLLRDVKIRGRFTSGVKVAVPMIGQTLGHARIEQELGRRRHGSGVPCDRQQTRAGCKDD